MPQFCSLFYAILQSWRPKGGAMAQWPPPPKYTPGQEGKWQLDSKTEKGHFAISWPEQVGE